MEIEIQVWKRQNKATRHSLPHSIQLHVIMAEQELSSYDSSGVGHLIDPCDDVSGHPIECTGGVFEQSVIDHSPPSLLQCDTMRCYEM